MYLSLKTILLLGATLIAAAPTTNDVTSDAIQSKEIEVSGVHILLDGLTMYTPRFKDLMNVFKGMDDDTHIIIHKRADGRGIVARHKGDPADRCKKPAADSGNLVAREPHGCKWGCFKKYGLVLGRKCMKDCED